MKQMFSIEKLEEIALVLENEHAFYEEYSDKRLQSPGVAREVIRGHVRKLYRELSVTAVQLSEMPKWQNWAHDAEMLRRYFDKRYGCFSRPPEGSYSTGYEVSTLTLPVLYDEDKPQPKPVDTDQPHVTPETPKEPTTMNTNTAIEITTKTLVNGVDVSSMSDSTIYDLIASQEAKIKELELIETKPKKLVAEITKRREGIAALVAYLDSTTK